MQLLLFKNHNFLIWFHTRNHNDILFIPLNLLLWNQQDWLRFLPFFLWSWQWTHARCDRSGLLPGISSRLVFKTLDALLWISFLLYKFLWDGLPFFVVIFFYQFLCLKNAVPDVSTKHAKFDNSTIKSCKKGYDSKYAVIIKEFSQLI